MRNPLFDFEFLKQLDQQHNKELFAKIILLTFDEHPIQEIQGTITGGGPVSIDGNSAVRRTCSLTMVTNDTNINNTYWALKNKFKLEVGVKNDINSNYPDIIWFKQGLFVFTSINMNVQAQNYTISLSGKDKMCLLNGEVSGTITAETDFGTIEEYETLESGEIIRNIIHIPIVDIIKNSVHVYGGQPLENIVINDVEDYGLELLEYRGDEPLYLVRRIEDDNGSVSNYIMDGTTTRYYWKITKDEQGNIKGENATIAIKDIPKEQYYNLAAIGENDNEDVLIVYTEPIVEYDYDNKLAYGDSNKEKLLQGYNIIRLEFGDTAGYRLTELTYPGDLIGQVGSNFTAILDKIKQTFSDFEYFFDIDGRFIFQKKRNYINTSWNNITNDGDKKMYVDSAAYNSSIVYSFEENVLLSAFANTPAINNIKNDFAVWGKRTGVSGAEIPVHLRYAIDHKPTIYYPVRWEKKDGQIISDMLELPPYVTSAHALAAEAVTPAAADNTKPILVDWREIIYQMAYDYYGFNHLIPEFSALLRERNPITCATGRTGYENYYIDIQGFWRQLYNPNIEAEAKKEKDAAINNAMKQYIDNKYNKDDYQKQIKSIFEDYYSQLIEYQYCDNFDFNKITYNIDTSISNKEIDKPTVSIKEGLFQEKPDDFSNKYWNEAVTNYPENLNFWFDFLDSPNSELEKYTVSAIGTRSKAVNNQNVKAISYKETPNVIFTIDGEKVDVSDKTGYTIINLPSSMENYFTISSQGVSAQDELSSLLYTHTYATENVSLTSVPIFYLQPNTRVFVRDKNTQVMGEYIITKVSVPLQYNGTTSITVSKAVERIY